jgi:hypothetical protein
MPTPVNAKNQHLKQIMKHHEFQLKYLVQIENEKTEIII